MRRTKEQKGITLIALIITIVVLMVLAAVAISAIKNDGIMGHAQNATNKFTEEQQKEQDILNYYELVLSGKAWTQNGTKVTRGDVTLEVGDYLSYDSGYGLSEEGSWRVLGAEYGQLLILSKDAGVLPLAGTTSYFNGVTSLNAFCEKYVNEDYATRARSVKVDDINRVVGYNPDEAKFKHDTAIETGKYGNVVKYKMNEAGTYVSFAGPDGVWITADGTDARAENESNATFKKLDGKYLAKDEILTEKSNYYRYNIELDSNTKAYDMIVQDETNYWLADNYVYARYGRVVYGIRQFVGKQITGHPMLNTHTGEELSFNGSVRAVVHISPDVEVKPNGTFDNVPRWKLEK